MSSKKKKDIIDSEVIKKENGDEIMEKNGKVVDQVYDSADSLGG